MSDPSELSTPNHATDPVAAGSPTAPPSLPPPPAPAAPRSVARRMLGHPLMHLLAAVLILALVQGLWIKVFRVPSGSMEHTLEVGDRILVNRLAGAPRTGDIVVFQADETLWPSGRSTEAPGPIGSVILAGKWLLGDLLGIGPTTAHMLVKRVIATESQTVSCCDAEGRVLVDGEPLDEPYIFEDPTFVPGEADCSAPIASQRCFPELTVPEGMLLVLGDHRGSSSDSVATCRGLRAPTSGEACVRWARESQVMGTVFAVIWPVNRIGPPRATP